jgi:hypothetical protein
LYLQYKNTLKHVSCVLIAALLLVFVGAAQADSVGAITGYATVTSANGDTKRLKLGDTLEVGDVVNTGNESSITIVLANGTTITLGSLQTYTVVKGSDGGGDNGFAPSSLSSKSPTLSTATSAGGSVETTPDPGGSPTN